MNASARPEQPLPYVCPACRAALNADGAAVECTRCRRVYEITNGIADFSGGEYYDQFDGDAAVLDDDARAGLEGEVQGTRERVELYYAPRLRSSLPPGAFVLDSGCGNGLSVELLAQHGFEAWGHDLSQLRKWQWRSLGHRDRLSVADGRRLPFADDSFDAALSSGVIEHIGVQEWRDGATYNVRLAPDRDDARRSYLGELLRVVKPGGVIFVDCPNGSCPLDFWHSATPGRVRAHSLREGFLPSLRELRSLVHSLVPSATVTAVSPHNRLQFRQVGRHWYGRAFALPMRLLFRASASRAGAFLSASPLLPYLVVRIDVPR